MYITVSSNLKKISLDFCSITVPGVEKAQELLSYFQEEAYQKDELERIRLAKKVCDIWKKETIPFPLPAVPEREDYWYLVQLFSLKRHVHLDKHPYLFDLGRSEDILIENFPGVDYDILKNFDNDPSSPLIKFLFQITAKNGLKPITINLKKPSSMLSRNTIDKLLLYSDIVLSKLGLDQNKYKIINIPFDIYLRLSNKMNLGEFNYNTHFDGYRLRSDGKMTGLFGGNKLFGGSSFIDSVWTDVPNRSISTRLVIIRKDYGY